MNANLDICKHCPHIIYVRTKSKWTIPNGGLRIIYQCTFKEGGSRLSKVLASTDEGISGINHYQPVPEDRCEMLPEMIFRRVTSEKNTKNHP